jgi:hypothetical protein
MIDAPIYALLRSGLDRWLVLALDDDPCSPAVSRVAVLDEPA